MKQVKFLLVALMAILMGASVTSCMKGDDNTIYTRPAFAKCINSFPPTFALADGQKLVLSNSSLLSINEGEIYFFYYEFDSAQQNPSSPSLNVTLYNNNAPTSITAKSSEGPSNASEFTKANAALYVFNGQLNGEAIQPAILFSNEYLLAPVVYWVKVESTEEKQKEELDKHSFVLTYDDTAIKAGDTELVMTLNHVINDAPLGEGETPVVRDKYTSTYKAYNLSNAMYAFQSIAGNKPIKITIKAQTNSSKNSLDQAVEQKWEYTIKE